MLRNKLLGRSFLSDLDKLVLLSGLGDMLPPQLIQRSPES